VERAQLIVIKRDGRREPFTREKLVEGIERACRKRPVPTDDVALAVERILEDLAASFERELSSEAIGERVMRELRTLDPVAYIRFASIYRQFEEVDDFLQEVHLLTSQKIPDKRQLSLELLAEASRRAKHSKEPSL
jgi:transcriptional repressor NrdR